jgi:hypothetical protein
MRWEDKAQRGLATGTISWAPPTAAARPHLHVRQEEDGGRGAARLHHRVHQRLLGRAGPRVRQQRGQAQRMHRQALQSVQSGGAQVALAAAVRAADEEAGALHAQRRAGGPAEAAAAVVGQAGGGVARAAKAGAHAGGGGGEAGLQLGQQALQVVQQHGGHQGGQRPARGARCVCGWVGGGQGCVTVASALGPAIHTEDPPPKNNEEQKAAAAEPQAPGGCGC